MSEQQKRAEDELEAVADLILDALFSNAFGEQARRLELRDDQERGLGGWSRAGARIQILKALASRVSR